ncbi:UV-stimulated scaffold protein A-like isoform X2 [Adelges cooleyi]|uniref:UV-stimulated scaffold protein A-like isoform X2 n=1 Tax=Adelges cooleyi TaxID=133065 RepID=UPI00217FDB12|nr:UV-stimulated scaffold protein A-like isoform X2 [Adelges cooleyi]
MVLDYDTVNRAADLVESLTNNGQDFFNRSNAELNEIENICKKSPEYVERVHVLVLHQLKEKHSEVRLGALRICDCLFKKYEHFRKLVVDDLSVFLKLTVNTDMTKPLPPPKKFARELEMAAVRCIKEWKDNFGADFVDEFDFAFSYLNKYKKIDFQSMTVRSLDEARRVEDRERRQKHVNEKKLRKIRNELKELKPEIMVSATSLESCLELLIPTPEEFSIPEVENDSGDGRSSLPVVHDSVAVNVSDERVAFRETGIIDPGHSVTVLLKPGFRTRVKKTEDNRAIVETADEQTKLITGKYLPKVKQWLQDVAKMTNSEDGLLRKIIELKQYLSHLMDRENRITYYEEENDSDDDSDMEEVLPPACSADELLAQRISNSCGTDQFTEETAVRPPESTGEQKKHTMAVPTLPFDVDLYHWEDDDVPVPRLLPTNPDGHSFWSSNSVMETDGDGIVQPGGSSSLRTRVIEFTGKFERVDRQCRAPLPSGRLCPREDRFKCPFHGRIVARDEVGRPIDPEDEVALEKEKSTDVPEWQDPQLLRDIQSETGVDLTMPKKGSKKKVHKYPKLTDLKKEQDTPRARLEKKIFKKSSVKKVAKILDSMDQRKFRDKFGDQFNYVHDTA